MYRKSERERDSKSESVTERERVTESKEERKRKIVTKMCRICCSMCA